MNSKAEETIFEATLALPPEKRAAYLDLACGNDPQLHLRIEYPTLAHRRVGVFKGSKVVLVNRYNYI